MTNTTTSKVIKLFTGFGEYQKFVKRYEYNGATIYWHKTPTGFFVHRDYAIVHNDKIIHIDSYNNICSEEIEDIIDNYNSTGKYSIKCFYKTDNEPAFYEMHPNGNVNI